MTSRTSNVYPTGNAGCILSDSNQADRGRVGAPCRGGHQAQTDFAPRSLGYPFGGVTARNPSAGLVVLDTTEVITNG